MNAQQPDKYRLDQLLVTRGLFASRSRAADAIRRGTVVVSGAVMDQPGARVPADAEFIVDDPAARYVSRAALKLVAGLDRFGFDPSARTCLDIGASTGGFTQVLLERGAAHVLAIDVGHGQMTPDLAADARVTNLEGINARALAADDMQGTAPQAVVSDVSFISLKLALPPALVLAAPGAWGLFLVKPQFEVGRDAIGKGGIVKDAALAEAVVAGIAEWLDAQPGWRVVGIHPSPIEGGDGNREFLLGAVKADG